MKIQNVGIMSIGDMGNAVAIQLKRKGLTVYTALDKRSARTRALAQKAEVIDVGSLEKLTEQCEIVLSIMDPAGALDFATELASVLRTTRRNVLFVDCNSIAPMTMHEIEKKITDAGGRCADVGIIGGAPHGAGKTLFCVSGADAAEVEQLATPQIIMKAMGERVGDASAIKLCYSGMGKGTMAMVLGLMIVARRLGIEAPLEAQIKERWGLFYEDVMSGLPRMVPRAYRIVPEMLEVAQTFEAVGMTARLYEGAADIYEYVAGTKLGKETPENRDKSRLGKDVVRLLDTDQR